MKKIFTLILFATMMATNVTFAQSTQIISLNHEGTITTYTDFSDAYNAAKTGDVITLSSGYWNIENDFTFNKKVKIRGAGMNNSELNFSSYSCHIYPGTFFEGIELYSSYITFHPTTGKIEFLKCHIGRPLSSSSWSSDYFYNYRLQSEGSGGALNFYNCKVYRLDCNANVRVICLNSYIEYPYVENDESSFNCINCCVTFAAPGNDHYIPYDMSYSTFENCILQYNYDDDRYSYYRYFPSTVKAKKNLSRYSICERTENANDNYVITVTEEEELEELIKDSDIFQLTDKAKAMYLGTDGTVVGVEGGMLPWSTTTSVPRITKFNVAEKAVDNKLSVDISVNDAE